MPPVASVHNVVDDYFGTKVTDPYRWMEDMKSSEFQTWMKAENDYTRSIIDSVPGRKKLLSAIAEYDNSRATVIDLQKLADGSASARKTHGRGSRGGAIRSPRSRASAGQRQVDGGRDPWAESQHG